MATADEDGFGPFSSSSASYLNDNPPTVSIVPPTIFSTIQGTISFNYSDVDGDTPTKFQVRYRKQL